MLGSFVWTNYFITFMTSCRLCRLFNNFIYVINLNNCLEMLNKIIACFFKLLNIFQMKTFNVLFLCSGWWSPKQRIWCQWARVSSLQPGSTPKRQKRTYQSKQFWPSRRPISGNFPHFYNRLFMYFLNIMCTYFKTLLVVLWSTNLSSWRHIRLLKLCY